jgi:hypothetical protein
MKVKKWEAVHAARETEEKNGRGGSDKDAIPESLARPFIGVM